MIIDTEFDGNRNLAKAQLYTVQAYFPSRELEIWKIWKYRNQEQLVQDFVKWFLGVDDRILIGYNLLKVDVPLLLFRSATCEDADAFFEKINRCNIIDLHVILTFLNGGRIAGFGHWCEEFGIDYHPTIQSSQIKECLENGDYGSVEGRIDGEARAIAELHRKLFNRDRLEKALGILKEGD